MADSSKKYVVSREVLKYPYGGSRDESKEFLSKKFALIFFEFIKRLLKKRN
jgi:hypothetical protein